MPHLSRIDGCLTGLMAGDSIGLMAARLGDRLNGKTPPGIPLLPGPVIFARNALFLATVLFHGFRRLLPPY